MNSEAKRTIDILSVEDNPADRTLIEEFLIASKTHCRIHFALDGQECLDFLRKKGRFAQAPRPHLILLDLNLPRKDGREALEEIKKDEQLKHIPIIILSTSGSPEDIARSYDLGANCYLIKPNELDAFIRMMQLIYDFWIATCRLPPAQGQSSSL